MNNIKNIIFDYGNVIYNIDFSLAQQAWAKLGITNVESFFGHKQQSSLFDAFDKGEITAAQFRDQIRLAANNDNLTDEQIDTAWNSMLLGIQPGTHDLLLQLKGKYRTFLLSNINAIHYDHIMGYLKREFDFDGNAHLFEKVYYSHFMGMRKPNANIFEFVLQDSNLNPAETLFIDDSPQHLATAQKLDIQTFLMTAPDTIKALVEREKLL
ncbi:HAD family phosphatase [Mucilaginibacter sp. HMF5004]|uniref:HAD family hydrolase n=1 Tax=Mucilaginibacter rivuli TaxID=2857527 RepID=UPI001C5F1D19|nr:HAD family phosphatase [Mucilaginibacter rivuli]MBW4889186.1 HAD family phosphatase [Mucilaginibacter rivuli]